MERMEDMKSLLDIQTGPWNSLKSLWKYNNLILPVFGLLVFLSCIFFIFSVLFEKEDPCDDGWSKFHKSCYKLVMNYSDIEECRQDCRNQGAYLASVHSNEENDFIVSLLGESPTWIAGSITEEDGDFFWLDGSAWDFEHWDEGEPDKKKFGKTQHECVFLGNNWKDRGLWWDGVCRWSKWSHDCACKKS